MNSISGAAITGVERSESVTRAVAARIAGEWSRIFASHLFDRPIFIHLYTVESTDNDLLFVYRPRFLGHKSALRGLR